MEKLINLMSVNPMKRFNIPLGNSFTVWDLEKEWKIDPDKFLSKGKSTPFENVSVQGKCLTTVKNGKIIYSVK